MADGIPCHNIRETSMSKHQEKAERKSPAKPEIRKGSGALADQDLETVTGGGKAAPKEFPQEAVSFAYGAIEVKYTSQ
jgi:hypothetical protein